MSKRTGLSKQYVATDHELQRLKSLAGFGELERHLDADLERLTRRYAAWHLPGRSGSREHFACHERSI